MANEPINDFSVALNNLLKTVGTLAQQQVDLISLGIKAASQVIEPLVKSSTELAGNAVKLSSDLFGSILNTVGQVFQNVTSALAPKK